MFILAIAVSVSMLAVRCERKHVQSSAPGSEAFEVLVAGDRLLAHMLDERCRASFQRHRLAIMMLQISDPSSQENIVHRQYSVS